MQGLRSHPDYPYYLLIVGIFLVCVGVMSTLSGETLQRYGGTVHRDKEPFKYWSTVAMYYFGGALGIGSFLDKACARWHFLHLLLTPPDIYLIVGAIFFSTAVLWTCIGRVWIRLNGWVYRDKEPGWFWGGVATWYLCGIGLVGIFFYQFLQLYPLS
jgi:hypothetical protein